MADKYVIKARRRNEMLGIVRDVTVERGEEEVLAFNLPDTEDVLVKITERVVAEIGPVPVIWGAATKDLFIGTVPGEREAGAAEHVSSEQVGQSAQWLRDHGLDT